MPRVIVAGAVAFSILAHAVAGAQGPDPDALYRQRENPQAAMRATELWAARAPTSFEAAWKLARISYWSGSHAAPGERRAALERGIKAGETAVQLAANRPEGHFWLAANMGTLAETGGMTQGLKYKGRIKTELERVLAIDPRWETGSAEAALGRWYAKVPGLFGGDKKKAEEHLRRAIAINPESRTAMSDLAALLIDKGQRAEARGLLQRIIDLPVDPDWVPEDRELGAAAAATLKKLPR